MNTKLSRRDFLSTFASGIAYMGVRTPDWYPRFTFFAPQDVGPRGDVLVCIFQRGAMDGINVVIPYTESDYYKVRPTLAIPEPKAGNDKTIINLDGKFGLHPSLRPFKEIWDAKQLAPIHAAGSPDPTHSHFDAMDYMERGTPGEKQIPTGWLARHLQTVAWENKSPFRAVGMGTLLQTSLRGPVSATSLQSIAEFHLGGKNRSDPIKQFQAAISQMYSGSTPLDQSASLTLQATDMLEKVNVGTYKPANNAAYPKGNFGTALMQVAQLIKAEVGLEIAAVDLGGWDTHVRQGALEGDMPDLLAELSQGLAALYKDLGDKMKKVTIVTMSEFGRRVAENGGGGTDHGHGNVMFVMGGGVNGGKVYGDWPGISKDKLDGPGDLAITTDFRDVLGEIVQKRMLNDKLSEVFPNYSKFKMRDVLQKLT